MGQDAPPVRRGRPRDEKVDRAILDATLEELARSGYQGMSVDGVARRAGVSKPTIYRRWPSKPALAISGIAQLVDREAQTVGTPIDDLCAHLWSAHSNLQRSMSISLLGTLLAERDRHPEFIETYQQRLLLPRLAAIQLILDEAKAEGVIDPGVDTEGCAALMLGHLYSMYMLSRAVTQESIRRIVLMIWRGISTRG